MNFVTNHGEGAVKFVPHFEGGIDICSMKFDQILMAPLTINYEWTLKLTINALMYKDYSLLVLLCQSSLPSC